MVGSYGGVGVGLFLVALLKFGGGGLGCCSPQWREQNLGVLLPHGHSPYEKRKGKYCLHASMTQYFPFLFSHCSLLSWKLYHIFVSL